MTDKRFAGIVVTIFLLFAAVFVSAGWILQVLRIIIFLILPQRLIPYLQ